jgi:hypothetical protein
MNNLDHISESLKTIFLIKILTDTDPGSGIRYGMEKIRIREKKSRIRNTDPNAIKFKIILRSRENNKFEKSYKFHTS